MNNSIVGKPVQRIPCGRICKVLNATGDYLLIQDSGFWTGWISIKTYNKKWKVVVETDEEKGIEIK